MAARSQAKAQILQIIAQQGPQSRADLGRAIGLTRATAGNVVARLLDEGILHVPEIGNATEQRPVGRPGESVCINPDHTHVIGVDAGIGFVLALRMNLAGDVLAVERVKTRRTNSTPDALLELIVELTESVARDAPKIDGVSVAVPGIISRQGYVVRAPFLGWHDVPFRDLLAQRLTRFGPLSLENDANALAMGEVIRGNVSPDDMTIFFSMDVGVGGSIVRNGKLMDGQSGLAGEFGHIFVHPSSGNAAVRLENVIGRHALLDHYKALSGHKANLKEFLQALDAGDADALTVQEEWIEVLAQALSTITSVLNPGSIVFGGSLTALLERSLDALDVAYQALLMHGTAKPRILLAASAQHSVARGCGDIRRAAVFASG